MLRLLLIALALFGHTACSEEDYGGGYNPDEEEGDMGGAYGGEEPPPPPPPGDLRELLSVEEFDEFVNDMDASVIGAFSDKEIVDPEAVVPEGWDAEEDGEWSPPMIENPVLTNLNALSGSMYGYRFAFTTAPEVLAKLKSKKGGLYLYRSPKFVSKEAGDRPRERFPSEKLTENAVSNWLAAKAQPLVGLWSSTTKSRYSAVLVIFMNLNFETNAKSVTYVLKRARKAAAALKSEKLAVAVASLADSSYEASNFGYENINANGASILMGITKDGANYAPTEGTKFSGKTLDEFAKAYLAGELTPYEKPPAPDVPDSMPEDDSEMPEAEDSDDYKDEP